MICLVYLMHLLMQRAEASLSAATRAGAQDGVERRPHLSINRLLLFPT